MLLGRTSAGYTQLGLLKLGQLPRHLQLELNMMILENRLFHSDKIEVRKSKIDGYGVFAKENLKKNELLEECHYIEVGRDGDVNRYKFRWPKKETGPVEKSTIPLGFGCIYNSAIVKNKANADWITDLNNDVYIFRTIKDIKKDEEILTYYYNSIPD